MALWNLKVLVTFYGHLHREERAKDAAGGGGAHSVALPPLLDRDYVARVTVRVEQFFRRTAGRFRAPSASEQRSAVARYVRAPALTADLLAPTGGGGGGGSGAEEAALTMFTRYVLWHGIPNGMELAKARAVVGALTSDAIPALVADPALAAVPPAAWVAVLAHCE